MTPQIDHLVQQSKSTSGHVVISSDLLEEAKQQLTILFQDVTLKEFTNTMNVHFIMSTGKSDGSVLAFYKVDQQWRCHCPREFSVMGRHG